MFNSLLCARMYRGEEWDQRRSGRKLFFFCQELPQALQKQGQQLLHLQFTPCHFMWFYLSDCYHENMRWRYSGGCLIRITRCNSVVRATCINLWNGTRPALQSKHEGLFSSRECASWHKCSLNVHSSILKLDASHSQD